MGQGGIGKGGVVSGIDKCGLYKESGRGGVNGVFREITAYH